MASTPGGVRATLRRLFGALRPSPLPPLEGPQAELARTITLSSHALERFRERGPAPDGRARESTELALRRLIAARGRIAQRPPKWFRSSSGSRGAEFYVVIDSRYVLPVAISRPGQLARRGMRPYVVTTFVARRRSSR